MAKNNNLHNAKKAKNDEFFTLIEDVEKEVSQYKDQFKDKVIYCNCDDYKCSNFYKYFKDHFKEYKLKRLIASCLTGNYASYDGNVETTGQLQNGDFRGEESIELLKTADIIVSNSPFSLFREYIAQLIKYNKKFLIVGNQNAITYKEIFPLIRDEKIWLGNRKMSPWEFRVPKSTTKYKRIDDNGEKYDTLGLACWFTNLPVKRFDEKITLVKTYNSKDYPKYDNYNAIDVGKVADIPKNYPDVMGVPITFLYSYNPKQFEIVALGIRENFTPIKDYINPKEHMTNGKICNGNAINRVLAINTKIKPTKTYYTSDNSDYLIAPYARILIKKICKE